MSGRGGGRSPRSRGGSHRLERVNHLIRDEISQYLRRDVNDPRIVGLVSITEVETTADLSHAKVFVSVLGEPEQQRLTIATLNGAAGFIRSQLAARFTARTAPRLDFRLDDSIERGDRILRLMREVAGETTAP